MEIKIKDIESLVPELNPIDKKIYYSVICPSCGRREAYIYKNKSLIVCNRLNKCGYVSSVFDYLKNEKKLSNKDIFKLASKKDSSIEIVDYIKHDNLKLPNYKMFDEVNSSFFQKKALNYLLKRNIPENNIKKLGYIYDDEKYDNRIFIPFIEEEEIVYFTTRDITNSNYLRWKDPPEIDKHKFVYNIDEMWNTETIFIFEGLMCALSLKDQVGTAMLTNRIGEIQAKKIMSTYPKNIVLIPDVDKAGITSIKYNINMLKKFMNTGINTNFYIYIVDSKRKDEIEEILKLRLDKTKEYEMIEKIKGYKDFNETGENEIKLDKCYLYDKNIKSLKWRGKVVNHI